MSTSRVNAQTGWEYRGKVGVGGASLYDAEGRNRGVGLDILGSASASGPIQGASFFIRNASVEIFGNLTVFGANIHLISDDGDDIYFHLQKSSQMIGDTTNVTSNTFISYSDPYVLALTNAMLWVGGLEHHFQGNTYFHNDITVDKDLTVNRDLTTLIANITDHVVIVGDNGPPTNGFDGEYLLRLKTTDASVLDFGHNAVSPFSHWLQVYDNRDGNSDIYPLSLNPLGGDVLIGDDVRITGDAFVGGNISSGTTTPLSNVTIAGDDAQYFQAHSNTSQGVGLRLSNNNGLWTQYLNTNGRWAIFNGHSGTAADTMTINRDTNAAWFLGTVTADEHIDHTPGFTGTPEEALSEASEVRNHPDGSINHSTLGSASVVIRRGTVELVGRSLSKTSSRNTQALRRVRTRLQSHTTQITNNNNRDITRRERILKLEHLVSVLIQRVSVLEGN